MESTVNDAFTLSELSGSSEGLEIGGSEVDSEDNLKCHLCSKLYTDPRVLPCLHVFCTECIMHLVSSALKEEPGGIMECPVCQQRAALPDGGNVSCLPLDVVMLNARDVADVRRGNVVCTGCMSHKNAVAHCVDCCAFLCQSCVSAHRLMHCFENHTLMSFEELHNSDHVLELHKPMFCSLHPNENLAYFCYSCQVPLCKTCSTCPAHRLHHCQQISEAESSQFAELRGLVADLRTAKLGFEHSLDLLHAALSRLSAEKDNAREKIMMITLIQKQKLEKQQEKLLEELNQWHTDARKFAKSSYEAVEKAGSQLHDAVRFSERLLQCSNTQILPIRQLSLRRLHTLSSAAPYLLGAVKCQNGIEFDTDVSKFYAIVQAGFGHFANTDDSSGTSCCMTADDSLCLSRETYPKTGVADVSLMTVPPKVADSRSLSRYSSLPGSHTTAAIALAGSSSLSSSCLPSLGHMMSSISEQNVCNDTSSPTLSDSGISVDAASSSSSARGTAATETALNHRALTHMLSLPSGAVAAAEWPVSAVDGSRIGFTTSNTPALQKTNESSALSSLLSQLSVPSSNSSKLSDDLSYLLAGLVPDSVSSSSGSLHSTAAELLSNILMTKETPALPFSSVISNGTTADPITGSTTGKMLPMHIRCKIGEPGTGLGQFNSPHGFCLGMNEDIVVADTLNHRIQIFDKHGKFCSVFGTPGCEDGKLWHPRKLAFSHLSLHYVVCDWGNERSRLQLFTQHGQFVRKISVRYIEIIAGLTINAHGHIVAVDSMKPTVFCITERGELLRFFDCSSYMREPSDISVFGNEYYICDFKGHCIAVFSEDGKFIHRLGDESLTAYPNGIDTSDSGDILVGDSHGNRFHIVVLQRNGTVTAQLECPYMKVSRCCGLRVTSEGYIVTLSKNNQHVLVYNTVYVS